MALAGSFWLEELAGDSWAANWTVEDFGGVRNLAAKIHERHARPLYQVVHLDGGLQ